MNPQITPSIEQVLLEEKVIVIGDRYPVRSTSSVTPIGVFLQNILKPKNMEIIVNAMIEKMPDDVTCIAGFGFDGIPIAWELSKKLGKRCVALQHDSPLCKIAGFEERTPLAGENVALITGLVATGSHCSESLRLITEAGGECHNILTVFDYELYLKPKQLKEFKIHALATFKSVAEKIEFGNNSDLLYWINQNSNLFRPSKMHVA
jgi:orotate phosphoribosyltransferase